VRPHHTQNRHPRALHAAECFPRCSLAAGHATHSDLSFRTLLPKERAEFESASAARAQDKRTLRKTLNRVCTRGAATSRMTAATSAGAAAAQTAFGRAAASQPRISQARPPRLRTEIHWSHARRRRRQEAAAAAAAMKRRVETARSVHCVSGNVSVGDDPAQKRHRSPLKVSQETRARSTVCHGARGCQG